MEAAVVPLNDGTGRCVSVREVSSFQWVLCAGRKMCLY